MPHSFEDYDVKASTYTSMRRAIGWEKEVNHFKTNPQPIEEQILLDSGCGTGNYTVEFVKKKCFNAIHSSDYNGAMIREAKANYMNLCNSQGTVTPVTEVTFSTDDVSNMTDFGDEQFDAVCNNQVVHHLRPDDNFGDLRKAAKEWFRVLKPNGRLVINWSPKECHINGFWWAELIPTAIATLMERMPDCEQMKSALSEAGFENVRLEAHIEEILFDPELYNDPLNFLNIDSFRRSDSTFNLSNDEEIEAAVARVQKMKEDGTLTEWFEKKEEQRKECGQSMMIYVEKP